MSEPENYVECCEHGKQQATYVCQHTVQTLEDGYDLVFLVKNPDYLNALLNDAEATENLSYSAEIIKLEGSEFLSEIKKLAEYYGDDDEEYYLNFFSG